MLYLTLESPSYSMVPTSLVNPDIVLPHHEFRKRHGLRELPPGRGLEQREYTMDGARGLVDLDWSQRTPIFHTDDIDRDPRFNQYPYPDDDLDYDDEEEMETDFQNAPLGGTSDARVATLASAGHRCYRPPATYSMQMTQGQTLGSPRSIHTDTDTAMEMGGLSMAPGGPDTCRVPLRAKAPTAPGSMSTPELAATVARGVAAAATQILEWYAWPPNEAERPPVDQVADAALRERLQRHLKASPWTTPGSQPVSERISVFDRLGHRAQDTQKEDEWAPRHEMTPRKVERGRQVKSLRYFGRNARDFAMGIVAIADWGRRYLDKGLKYPIPTIPLYLFTPLPESRQSGAQVPVKPSQLGGPGGDVRHCCRESWKWLVTVLQFWTDEATVTNGAVYGGRVCPASALAEYVMDTVNPGLEPGSKVSWEDVITRTPWMSKRLHGMTTGQEQTVRRQALPMPGESSELEVLSEKLYAEYSKKMPSAGGGKSPLGRAGTLRLHLKKAEKGWTQASQSGTGLGVGNPKEVSSQSKQEIEPAQPFPSHQ